MNKVLTNVFLSITLVINSCSPEKVIPAQEVLERTIGNDAAKFNLVLFPSDGKNDWFKIDVKNDKATIKGNSQVALQRGIQVFERERNAKYFMGREQARNP